MFGLGVPELIIIGVIILLIFGPKLIPEIGKGLGGALREFKNIGKEIKASPKKTDSSTKLLEERSDVTSSLQNMVTQKVMENVPGVKKVMDINDKVNKVKEIIN